MHAEGLRPTIGIIQEHVDEFFWANRPRHKPPIESPKLNLLHLVWHSWPTCSVMKMLFYLYRLGVNSSAPHIPQLTLSSPKH